MMVAGTALAGGVLALGVSWHWPQAGEATGNAGGRRDRHRFWG